MSVTFFFCVSSPTIPICLNPSWAYEEQQPSVYFYHRNFSSNLSSFFFLTSSPFLLFLFFNFLGSPVFHLGGFLAVLFSSFPSSSAALPSHQTQLASRVHSSLDSRPSPLVASASLCIVASVNRHHRAYTSVSLLSGLTEGKSRNRVPTAQRIEIEGL